MDGGCCENLTGWHVEWVSHLLNRSGVPSAVIGQLAKAEPVGKTLGISNLADRPRSAAALNGKRQGLGLSLHIYRISSIDQKRQSFDMQYTTRWSWQDCRLLFNCKEVLSVDNDHPYYRDFWKPFVTVIEKEFEEVSVVTGRHSFWGEGVDHYVETHFSTFRCSFDFTKMPIDEQTCNITFALPGKDVLDYAVEWVDITADSLANAEWDILDVAQWSRDTSYISTSHSSTEVDLRLREGKMPILSTGFTLKRRPSYLINQFVYTCMLFYVLSWMSMWIDPAVIPARLAACTVPALTVSNKMNALASVLPPISYQTNIQNFMSMVLFLIVFNALAFVALHFAIRRMKASAEREKKYADASPEDADDRTLPAASIEQKLATCIVKYADPTLRIFSPLVLVVSSVVIFTH